ncbi:MAG: NAD-dependent epimerase/dehydratase family protein [Acidobacteriales bacterium]|nr:NAD-dependent epimerase/dehydratase family protein [Terriglobales bacterium]
MAPKPTIVVTGAAGNLGLRLLTLLGDYNILALDLRPPSGDLAGLPPFAFHATDLGRESSCDQLIHLFREHHVNAVIHLAFVIDPLRTGVLDRRRMWQINVAGTARVMEAIAEVNRLGGTIHKLIIPGSVSSYGPELPGRVKEDFPLGAHTLTYAVHKKESDEVIRARASHLGECSTFLLRPHIFVGHSMQNYLVGALRGTPSTHGRIGRWLTARGKRLPMLLPGGDDYLKKEFQFVHVDDVARLIVHILEKSDTKQGVVVLNVAGRGEPITIREAAEITQARLLRLPGLWLCRKILKKMWDWGISPAPPDSWPYMWGTYCMDLSRLEGFLGAKYHQVIRYTVPEALADSVIVTPPSEDPMDGVPAAKA